MGFDDAVANRKSESSACDGTLRSNTVEFLENQLFQSFRDPGTIVHDVELDLPAAYGRGYFDVGVGRGIFCGVLQKVHEYFFEENTIDVQHRQIPRDINGHRTGVEMILEPGEDRAEDFLQRVPLPVEM
jgi:hypothetical protein